MGVRQGACMLFSPNSEIYSVGQNEYFQQNYDEYISICFQN